ncbi:hypothetical protein [Vineibacter terrae]|uniref:hypothetical protein n=1 Tax=Vineibacter terrae TaxID=2586908 RepID=UPI001E5572F5|nr:hypothetical protein [Vineibacter terrae]
MSFNYSEFLFYFHIVVGYSFSGDALGSAGVGLIMVADSKPARRAPKLIFDSNIESEYIENITDREISYLRRGLDQAGGKLPLFDLDGQEFEPPMIRRCVERGWAEPWFSNPLKPDWLVCKLTTAGRAALEHALDLRARRSAPAAATWRQRRAG